MCGCRRLDDQCLCITNVSQMTNQLKAIYEFRGLLFVSMKFKRKHCTEAVLKVFFCISMIRTAFQTRVAYRFYSFMIFKPDRKGERIVYMALHAKGKGFQSL